MKNDFLKDWELIFEDKTSIKVDLPYDALIHERRYKECASGEAGAFFEGKKYIFKKVFNIHKENYSYFSLLFEGVYRNARVIFNDVELGINKYGFSEFSFDISNLVNEGINKLEVYVDNSLVPSARFYTGAGIYRPVRLIIKRKKEINSIKIKTLDYKERKIEVLVDSILKPTIKIYDKDDCIYNGNEQIITLRDANLWSDETPYLYKLIVETLNDKEEIFFGIREISFIKGKGLFVNGKETKLKGVCLHSDNGIVGMASYKEIEYQRIKLLKDAGFNAIRSAHNPCSRYILEACDFFGVYIIDELYDGWYIPKNYHDHSRDFSSLEYKKDIKSMINKDFNHPSVIIYSLGNEVSEINTQKGMNTLIDMTNYLRKEDDTRKITCGINLLICVYDKLGLGIYKDNEKYNKVPLKENKKTKEKKVGSNFFNYWTQKLGKLIFFINKTKLADKVENNISDVIDIVGLNYGSARYDIDNKYHKDRLLIGSETFINDAPFNYKKMDEINNLIGDFIWVGFDFLGEAGFGDWTYYSYKGLPLTYGSGLFDLINNKTILLNFMEMILNDKNDKPIIGIRPINHYNETPKISAWKMTNAISNYNFHNYVNKKMVVEVYSKYPFIKLYLNDKLLGIKKVKNNRVIFKQKYKLGYLKAIALNENKEEICYSIISSSDNKPHLNIRLSKEVLTLDSEDIIFVNVDVLNDKNELLPCYEEECEIITSSNLNLIALGSALSNNPEDYIHNKHKFYRGSIAFVIKGKNIGQGVIKIISKYVNEKIIHINIKEKNYE